MHIVYYPIECRSSAINFIVGWFTSLYWRDHLQPIDETLKAEDDDKRLSIATTEMLKLDCSNSRWMPLFSKNQEEMHEHICT